MRNVICDYLTKKKLVEIYEEENRAEQADDVGFFYKIVYTDPLLHFYYCILFSNLVEVQLEDFFVELLGSKASVKYLIQTHLNITVTDEMIEMCKKKASEFDGERMRRKYDIFGVESKENQSNSNTEEGDATTNMRLGPWYRLMKFLLQIEANCDKLYKMDDKFIKFLFSKLDNDEKIEVFALKPSPILLELAKNPENRKVIKEDLMKFYFFYDLEQMDFPDAFETANRMNYRRIRRIITCSAFKSIQNKIHFFYVMYPELCTFDSHIFKDRMRYLNRITAMPMKSKVLRTYLNIDLTKYSYFTRMITNLKAITSEQVHKGNCMVHLQLHYIKKAISEKKYSLFRTVFNDLIITNKETFIAFARTEFIDMDLKRVVQKMPGLVEYFGDILELTISHRTDGLFDLLGCVIETYPTRSCLEKLKQHQFYLTKEFVMKYDYLLNKV